MKELLLNRLLSLFTIEIDLASVFAVFAFKDLLNDRTTTMLFEIRN